MKKNIQFNHEAKTAIEALGLEMSQDEFAATLADISGDFVRKRHDKVSKLSEMLHDRLPYEAILFLATSDVHNKIQELVEDSPLLQMAAKLADLMSRDKDDKEQDMNMN